MLKQLMLEKEANHKVLHLLKVWKLFKQSQKNNLIQNPKNQVIQTDKIVLLSKQKNNLQKKKHKSK
jgi:hypothetical protein